MWIIPLTWFVGCFVAIVVHRTRAGIPFFARLQLLGPMFGWILLHAIKTIFWPFVLVAWFLRGRPGPNVVFGQKAQQRRLRPEADLPPAVRTPAS